MTGSQSDQNQQPEQYESYESYEPAEPSEGLIESDLKAEHGQMPPFTAALKRLTAAEEIKTAVRLMARTTQVSKIATEGKKKIELELHRLGYTATTTQNKAFYTTEFHPEDGEGRTFQMVGWHGTGRYIGGEKAILEFYDDEKSKVHPVVSIGVINEENINPAKQLEVIQHIIDYVKHHGVH